tara:strand:- start:70100 stop:71422 length:1323 start_codon:yes stop_codon:yes gene_type:complete
MKKVFIKTYGCQMNVYDSERIVESLSKAGIKETKNVDDSDVVVFNTCHIREKASEKLYSDIGRLKKFKGPKKVIVSGCVAQAENKEILKRSPDVDLVIGPQAYHRIPDYLDEIKNNQKVVETEFLIHDKFKKLNKRSKFIKKPTAFLTIQEGCDKFCTFCVVPYTRGAEYSRTTNEIIDEAKQLIDRGVKEITLLGQNVNAFHGKNSYGATINLGELIFQLSEISGLERLRYTTNHPRDVNQTLIDAHREVKILMPYMHLPIQSGSNKVLKLMNRRHTAEEYIKIIDNIRNARSDIAISSDFISGFPGETDKDFEDTLDIIKKINYAQSYSFIFSARPGTPASEMSAQVPNNIKSQRLKIMQEILKAQQFRFNKKFMNKEVSILIERAGKEKDQLIGKSPHSQSVYIQNPKLKIGDTIRVLIKSVKTNSLYGEFVEGTKS